jgi:hypothetical protein
LGWAEKFDFVDKLDRNILRWPRDPTPNREIPREGTAHGPREEVEEWGQEMRLDWKAAIRSLDEIRLGRASDFSRQAALCFFRIEMLDNGIAEAGSESVIAKWKVARVGHNAEELTVRIGRIAEMFWCQIYQNNWRPWWKQPPIEGIPAYV